VLNGYPLKTKLPEFYIHQDNTNIEETDHRAKAKMKMYAERRRNIHESNIKVGDTVLMKNTTDKGKLQPKFQDRPFEVIDRKGSMVTAQRGSETKTRNSSHFRKISTEEDPILISDDEDVPGPVTEVPVQAASQGAGSESLESMPLTPHNTPKPQTPTNTQTQPSTPLRRPRRSIKQPKHLSDYVVKIPKLIK
jgi:hypothetical protein